MAPPQIFRGHSIFFTILWRYQRTLDRLTLFRQRTNFGLQIVLWYFWDGYYWWWYSCLFSHIMWSPSVFESSWCVSRTSQKILKWTIQIPRNLLRNIFSQMMCQPHCRLYPLLNPSEINTSRKRFDNLSYFSPSIFNLMSKNKSVN